MNTTQKCPDVINYWTPDEVAECVSGLGSDLRRRLYELLENTPKEERKPQGGDGSNGTVEYPPEPDSYKGMRKYWPQLTEAEQQIIITAVQNDSIFQV